MDEKTKIPECCDTAEAIVEQFANFEFPIYIDRSGGPFDSAIVNLAIRLFRRTPAGNISKRTKVLFLNYCPFCGAAYPGEDIDGQST